MLSALKTSGRAEHAYPRDSSRVDRNEHSAYTPHGRVDCDVPLQEARYSRGRCEERRALRELGAR